MKAKILFLSVIGLLVFASAQKQTDVSQKLIGTWKWTTVFDAETNQDMGIDMLTMGMAAEIKTEFRKDNTYTESKLRKGTTEYSTTNGEWKLEDNEILSLKMKEKWRPAKILKLSNDTLMLQINQKMHLLLIKQK